MSKENAVITKIDKLTIKINKIKSDIKIIHCKQCHTYFEELEGVDLPDFKGRCPLCGEENEWEVKNILDGRKDIIKLLNSGDLNL